MNKFYRKIIPFFFFFLFFADSLFAQQKHFIYIQTENKQPFYIKLDKKILSSSASGYLIIPKLQEGNYPLTIGFPKNEWIEQNVTCAINSTDAVYLLKNFGDKGWGLFNLQTMEVIMSGVKPVEKKIVEDENKKDVFSNTLSNVVNDPSIAKKTDDKPVIKEEVKSMPKEVVKEESLKSITQITKLLSNKSEEGTELVYADKADGQEDTIRIFIPEERKDTLLQPARQAADIGVQLPKIEAAPKEEIKGGDIKKDEPKNNIDPKFIDIELPNPNAKVDTALKKSPQPGTIVNEAKVDKVQIPETTKEIKETERIKEIEKPEKIRETEKTESKPVIANSDCKNYASENDFLKLRKKMAAENSDDDMVSLAKKAFRSKCFTTEQIKNLSVLFLKDEGKYKFFDATYPFASDSYNFSSLESQLSDNYFISRFRAMIRH